MQPDTPQTQPHKKVLVIEDEHLINELYSRALQKGGYEVTIKIDGQEALDEALTNTYDIILLDIMLPTVTGFDILKKLRGPEAPTDFKAKIIITTNLEQSEANRAEIEKQADGYLVKADITPNQLVEFLNQLA